MAMPMYDLIEYSYSKTFGSLWQYYIYQSSLTDDGVINVINNFPSNSASFKFKQHSNFICELCHT